MLSQDRLIPAVRVLTALIRVMNEEARLGPTTKDRHPQGILGQGAGHSTAHRPTHDPRLNRSRMAAK